MKHPKIPLAQTVIQLCKAKNVKHIIISPGSRSAPLTMGFTHDDYFKCYSIVDERCAAFFALGIAQQLQEAIALICTSGSALLNYYPAIAEAFYSDIPLVVLSADRPEHLIGIGDGQTINQVNVFANHILYSASLVLGSKEQNELDINLALNLAVKNKGPVHINIPFNEPLYDVVDELTVTPKIIDADEVLESVENIKEFITSWNASKKKIILVGVNQPNQIEQQWLDVLANNDSIIVFTETTSNLHHAEFFPSIDKIIAPLDESALKNLQPDILLTFGGMIVSKKVKAFLRTYKPEQHWHVDTKKANDTFFSLSEHIKVTPNYFLSKLLPKAINKRSEYKPNWNTVKTHRSLKHDEYIAQIEFSDLKVFDYLLKALPDHSILQLGNSSAVRYAQLFNLNQSLEVFCNRGTSGIDGSTATAIGSAIVNNKQTTLITGDLSFLYDSNALWNNYIPKSFRIIVINNGGGGIFRILPGHKDTENFDKYFETNHNLTAQHLCKMYGFEYSDSENMDDLFEELNSFFLIGNKPKLLEIFTPRKVNDSILLDYFKRIK
jgi:2-succinyl-5-enolpyruvyl-6-hydroxy-3-cyclohexene-1-carboxylate synthase